ncbi:hypothetical protein HCI50_00005 [Escherichia coli]|nr:hypothetical protein [Escherichia coli]
MKQSERAAVQHFIDQRRAEIEDNYKLAVENAVQRADLARDTYLSEHKYTMIQGPILVALQIFQEKIHEGYELVETHEQRFWPEVTPNGFLNIPMIVPQKQLQEPAGKVRRRVLNEQLSLARDARDSALAGLETEVLDFLIAYRANATEQADADAVRTLLKGVEASDAN